MVNRNGNMEKNYHGLQALNCVEYKDNRKGTEANRSWASKAVFFFFSEDFRFFILNFHQNKAIRRHFILPASNVVSTNFSAPYSNYL